MGGDTEGSPEPGRYVAIAWRGHRARAWVPAALADRTTLHLALRETTVRRTERASALAKQASDALPVGWVAIGRLLARSEGIASSFVEGIEAPLADVALAASRLGGSPAAAAIAENMAALHRATDDGPTTFRLSLMHEWHRILMAHATHLPAEMIGQFRREQGWIGGASPLDAALITSPPEFLDELMADLETFINRDEFDPISHAAIAHAQFETIHPYGDGNGRIGRILIVWMLTKRLSLRVAPVVSMQLARDRGGYLSGLVLFQQGQRDPWISWFADIVAKAAAASIVITERVGALMTEWENRLGPVRADATARKVLSLFPERFVVTAGDVAQSAGVSERAARSALNELHRHAIAEVIPFASTRLGRAPKVWVAPELAALLRSW